MTKENASKLWKMILTIQKLKQKKLWDNNEKICNILKYKLEMKLEILEIDHSFR
jgi:hypothetical protein